MFESIVNFLSPAVLSTSFRSEAAAAAPESTKMITRRTRASLESRAAEVAAISTVTTETMVQENFGCSDPIGVDFSGPLLTPEASRSETSSNHDLVVVGDEKPQPRRRSTRVTRMSLRALENLRDLEEKNKPKHHDGPLFTTESATTREEKFLDQVVDNHASLSTLENDATLESTSWDQESLSKGAADNVVENAHLATPVSKRSEEEKEEELPRRRSLRARRVNDDNDVKDNDGKDKTQKAKEKSPATNKQEKIPPPRRSSRLSLVTKAVEVLERAATVLGKRSRDATEKSVQQRRASLRPRHSLPAKDSLVASRSSNELPNPKKRRVSEGDMQMKKNEQMEAEAAKMEEAEKLVPAVPQFKPKRWLDQGMYTGQERDYDPRLNEANNKIRAAKRRAAREPQRKLLPLPMFAGERLLKLGRDFKLPYDIFSPLPPGQPKPDEWKKVNRSK